MALSRTDISDGLVDELQAFEQLVRSLTPAELDSPTRCAGWTVGDVARHVIGSMADVTAGRLDGLGTPEVTAHEVSERAGRGGYDGTLGQGVEALWYDTWLHGDDIRHSIGHSPEIGNGIRAALSHVEFELRKRDWSGPVPALGVPDAFGFILAATGRVPAASFGAQAPIDIYAA